jgi:hypothetical protein
MKEETSMSTFGVPVFPVSETEPVCVGDIVTAKSFGEAQTFHMVQMMRTCDCPQYGAAPHLHFVCTEVYPTTWKRINGGQTYHSGYRYEGARLLGRSWPEGSNQFYRCGGALDKEGRDELFVVHRVSAADSTEPVKPKAAAVPRKQSPAQPVVATTLTMEGF